MKKETSDTHFIDPALPLAMLARDGGLGALELLLHAVLLALGVLQPRLQPVDLALGLLHLLLELFHLGRPLGDERLEGRNDININIRFF